MIPSPGAAPVLTAFPWADVVVLIVLVAINALFATAELAIVSSRVARLKLLAERGSARARAALCLAENPGRFLSTVQAGITIIGVVAGAFSGVRLGAPLGALLARAGMAPQWASRAGFALAIALTTYANLVLGELVPKRLALRAPERIACVMARPMMRFAQVTAPLVWLLDASSALLVSLMGAREGPHQAVTEEEVRLVMAEATSAGAIEEEEHALMAGILRLAERPVREMMTPRTEIDAINLAADPPAIAARLAQSPHSLLPVFDGAADNIVGVVRARDLLARLLAGAPPDLATLMRKAEVIPDQIDAIDGLRILRRSGVGMGLIHDEYGHLQGIVTPADLLGALVGDFASDRDEGDVPLIEEAGEGAVLIAGGLGADALAERLRLILPEPRDYATAAGFVLAVLKHLPQPGERFREQGWDFVVVEMVGRRIVRLRASPASAAI